MKLLFLRGGVPRDRDPKQIMFNSLEEQDCMWTQLAYAMCKKGQGEIWYWGGKRTVQYKPNFTERWLKNFKVDPTPFRPDVIMARGGFSEYDRVLKRNPQAFKIYYGAGKRFCPQSAFKNYDLILVDSKAQLKEVKKKFPNIKSSLFIKPAADNIFKPRKSNKEFDVIFVGNEHPRGIKNHVFAFETLPRNLKILQVGIASKSLRRRFPHVKYTGWIPRRKIPSCYAKAKIALVCADTVDSCPRVIPEALACGCPLVSVDKVRFWHEKYITKETGILVPKNKLVNGITDALRRYDEFSPRKYYERELCLDVAANYIRSLIK